MAYVVTDGAGNDLTITSKSVGGGQLMMSLPASSDGLEISNTNPLAVSLQGSTYAPFSAVIAAAGFRSGIIDLGAYRLYSIAVPAGWTSAPLSFRASVDGTTFYYLYLGNGDPISLEADASRLIVVNPDLFKGFRYLQVQSGLPFATVPQTNQMTLNIIGMPY